MSLEVYEKPTHILFTAHYLLPYAVIPLAALITSSAMPDGVSA